MMKWVKTNELANRPPANSLGGDGSCAFHTTFPLTPTLSLVERARVRGTGLQLNASHQRNRYERA